MFRSLCLIAASTAGEGREGTKEWAGGGETKLIAASTAGEGWEGTKEWAGGEETKRGRRGGGDDTIARVETQARSYTRPQHAHTRVHTHLFRLHARFLSLLQYPQLPSVLFV